MAAGVFLGANLPGAARAQEEREQDETPAPVAGDERPATEAGVEDATEDAAPVFDEAPGPSPANRAARSAAFPAWGQLTNGKPIKAAVVFALEAYLVSGIVIQTRRGSADRRLADATADPAAREIALGLADGHDDRRRNLIFWGMLAMLYGIVDAYVDGYLGDFDEEIEEGRRLFGGVDPVHGEVEVGVRF